MPSDLEPLFAAEQIGFPMLSVLIGLPLAWAILLAFVRDHRAVRVAALAGAGLELLLSLMMLAALRRKSPGCSWWSDPSGFRA